MSERTAWMLGQSAPTRTSAHAPISSSRRTRRRATPAKQRAGAQPVSAHPGHTVDLGLLAQVLQTLTTQKLNAKPLVQAIDRLAAGYQLTGLCDGAQARGKIGYGTARGEGPAAAAHAFGTKPVRCCAQF